MADQTIWPRLDQAGGQCLYKGQRGGHTLGLVLPLAQGPTSIGPAPRELGSPHGFMPRSIRQPSQTPIRSYFMPGLSQTQSRLGRFSSILFSGFGLFGSVGNHFSACPLWSAVICPTFKSHTPLMLISISSPPDSWPHHHLPG